jgi:hypothetical protein
MPRIDREKVKLLHGPYKAPPLRKGDRATCLYRDKNVVITRWSDARISWPLCRPLGKGQPSLLLDKELARAVRCESRNVRTDDGCPEKKRGRS